MYKEVNSYEKQLNKIKKNMTGGGICVILSRPAAQSLHAFMKVQPFKEKTSKTHSISTSTFPETRAQPKVKNN